MLIKELNVAVQGSQPYLKASVYLHELDETFTFPTRPLIIVCPGGGYRFTSAREADPIALQFNAMGYHAAILRYSVSPGAHFPTALLELGNLLSQIRSHSEEWHVDPDRIAVIGFSAGGHLACSYCCLWNEPWVAETLGVPTEQLRPNGMLLSYPVITSGEKAHQGSFQELLGDEYEARKDELSLEHRVTEAVPPAFIWHTWEDGSVPVENSLLLVSALAAKKIPCEFHVFQHGGHGLSLANWTVNNFTDDLPCAQWIPLLHTWLERWRKHD